MDYSVLVELIEQNWDLLSYALLQQAAWSGRQEELRMIRHRIAHLRRPHPDDLARLEQTLRDLERGAFIALASYNRRRTPEVDEHRDALTEAWVRGHHPTARRLIDHADRQYGTTVVVQVSRRPWATWPSDLTGAPGVLWHVDFFLRRLSVDLGALWHESSLLPAKHLAVHVLGDDPHHVGFTFAAVDDSDQVADAIGAAFDAVLMVARDRELDFDTWRERATSLDYRVQANSYWNIVDTSTVPITIFGAGGGVEVPTW
jgi:hypothetical protein